MDVFDDDSDAPSLAEEDYDSDEDEAIVDHTNVSADNEDELQTSDGWIYTSQAAIARRIDIRIGDVDAHMMKNFLEQAKYCLRNVQKERDGAHPNDQLCPKSVQLTQCFIPDELWVLLLKNINSNLRSWKSPPPPATMRELELLVRLLFALGSCRISFGELIERKATFPMAWLIVTSFCGNSQDQIQRVKILLRAMDPSQTKQSKNKEGDPFWQERFSTNKFLNSIESIVSHHCTGLVWKPGLALCIDDDKMRNRSSLAALDFGFSRNKTPKSFGPVFNMVSLLGLGLFVGGTMSRQGDTMETVNNRLMRRLCKVEENEAIDMGLSTLANDRGYNGQVYHESLVGYNARSLNTIKREPSLPYTFGKVGYKKPDTQIEIKEEGPRSVFSASRKISKDGKEATQVLIGYRSGTGKVTLLGSTNPDRGAEKWTLVPKNMNSWREKINDPKCNVELFLAGNSVTSITQSQGDPVWFAMRQFRFTSTTTMGVARRIAKETNKHRDWLPSIRVWTEDIGIIESPNSPQNLDPLETYKDIIAMDENNMALTCSKTELANVLRALQVKGRTAIGRAGKQAMAAAIKAQAINFRPPPALPEHLAFIRDSFLKPIGKGSTSRKAMELGKHNEDNVRRTLAEFLNESTVIQVEEAPVEFGLVARKTKPYLATSVDGIFSGKVSLDNGENWSSERELIALEIKTLSSESSLASFKETIDRIVDDDVFDTTASITDASKLHRSTKCCFGDETFKTIVSNVGYRMQILHHATVLGLSKVLFCVANKRCIVGALLVDIPVTQRNEYELILDRYVEHHTAYLYSDPSTAIDQLSNIEEFDMSQGKYTVEKGTVVLNFAMWSKLNTLREKLKGPLPATRALLPKIVQEWNSSKGFVDVLSRYLAHVKFLLSNGSPGMHNLVRLLYLCAINAFVVERLDMIDLNDPVSIYSYISLKKAMSDSKSLRCFFDQLSRLFRIPFNCRSGEDTANERSVFSPPDKAPSSSEHYIYTGDTIAARDVDLLEFKTLVQSKSDRTSWVSFFSRNDVATCIRLDPRLGHYAEKRKGETKKCALCSARRNTLCAVCFTPLCIEVPESENGVTCFHAWHNRNVNLATERDKRERLWDPNSTRKRLTQQLDSAADTPEATAESSTPAAGFGSSGTTTANSSTESQTQTNQRGGRKKRSKT